MTAPARPPALLARNVGATVVVRAEGEPPDAGRDFATALPPGPAVVVCTAAANANPGLFAVLPAIVTDHFPGSPGVRLVLLGGDIASGVRAVNAAHGLAEQLRVPVTVPLGPLYDGTGPARWVTCSPDGTSVYEDPWDGLPPSSAGPVVLRPTPTIPVHRGIRTAGGWTFATVPSPVGSGRALAGPLIEVDAGPEGFLVAGLPYPAAPFAELLTARLSGPTGPVGSVVVFGHGLPDQPKLLAELADALGVPVVSPAGEMSVSWSGVLTTTTDFLCWTPGNPDPDPLGPILPVPETPENHPQISAAPASAAPVSPAPISAAPATAAPGSAAPGLGGPGYAAPGAGAPGAGGPGLGGPGLDGPGLGGPGAAGPRATGSPPTAPRLADSPTVEVRPAPERRGRAARGVGAGAAPALGEAPTVETPRPVAVPTLSPANSVALRLPKRGKQAAPPPQEAPVPLSAPTAGPASAAAPTKSPVPSIIPIPTGGLDRAQGPAEGPYQAQRAAETLDQTQKLAPGPDRAQKPSPDSDQSDGAADGSDQTRNPTQASDQARNPAEAPAPARSSADRLEQVRNPAQASDEARSVADGLEQVRNPVQASDEARSVADGLEQVRNPAEVPDQAPSVADEAGRKPAGDSGAARKPAVAVVARRPEPVSAAMIALLTPHPTAEAGAVAVPVPVPRLVEAVAAEAEGAAPGPGENVAALAVGDAPEAQAGPESGSQAESGTDAEGGTQAESATQAGSATEAGSGTDAVVEAAIAPEPVLAPRPSVGRPLWISASDWTADDRPRLRTVLSGRYDTHARVVVRTLAEQPGLRAASDSVELVAGLVALRAYCAGEREQVNKALRTGRGADDAAVVARGAAYGLKAMPAVLGPVYRTGRLTAEQTAAYRTGAELVEPGFLDVHLSAGKPSAGCTEFVIWSVSARRLGKLGGDEPAALFPPATRFVVLGVDEGRVLLCDTGPGRPGTDRVLARLQAVAAGSAERAEAAEAPGVDEAGRAYRRDEVVA
ncbi:hypothetical protein BJ973_003889 [Actinoplanes tereljensis]|uniref:NAD(+)--protein-arginine ADP-ribosyltransferase n=1 Tax=Paractinoplanes tereljensis TaxID=571912 RepID=A0A919TWX1_9ACTN|nr:hypothetical protein [Actinoplanes tereljensis]GIF25611.1 hypothetical protein Ate02nite_83410 [Actinoplanes tereljensis]